MVNYLLKIFLYGYIHLNFIDNLYTTCGYHPTRCNEFNESNKSEILEQMIELCGQNSKKIVAIGEFGLDYERTQFCDIEQQKR
jgi:TatD DNase family protein